MAARSNGRLALEIAFWALAFAAVWLFPRKLLLLNEITILGLFALSLDLLLALQLHLSSGSESMGDHDSEVMGWLVHRLRRRWSFGRLRCGT
jgi:hypothetical protein